MTVLTADAPSPPYAVAARFDDLSGELADAITEAVTRPRNPESRSAAVCSLVQEIYASIEWVHGFDTEPDELASLAVLLTAAGDHRARMAAGLPDRIEPT